MSEAGDAVIDDISVNVDDHDTGELDVYAYVGDERVHESIHQNASDAEVRAAQQRVADRAKKVQPGGGGIGAEIDKILGMYVTEGTIRFERNSGGIDETTANVVGRLDLLRDALVTAVSARFAALEADLAAARSVRLLARQDVSDIQYALDVAGNESVLGAARCADLCAAVARLAAPADEVAS